MLYSFVSFVLFVWHYLFKTTNKKKDVGNNKKKRNNRKAHFVVPMNISLNVALDIRLMHTKAIKWVCFFFFEAFFKKKPLLSDISMLTMNVIASMFQEYVKYLMSIVASLLSLPTVSIIRFDPLSTLIWPLFSSSPPPPPPPIYWLNWKYPHHCKRKRKKSPILWKRFFCCSKNNAIRKTVLLARDEKQCNEDV